MSMVAVLKRANTKHSPEESVALRVAVLVAVLAAALAAIAQGIGGPALRIAGTVGIAGGFAYSHWARFRQGYLLKAMLAAGVLVAFASFLRSTTGVTTGAVSELQIPLAELFLWVQFFHSLDVPARRDLLFSLLSSLVLIAVAAVLSVTSALAPNLIVWAVAAVVSLVLAHRSEIRALPALAAAEAPPASAGGRRRLRPGQLRPVVGLVALVGVLATGLFLIVPAAGAGKSVAFPTTLPEAIPVPGGGGLTNPSLGGADPASPDGRSSSVGSGAAASGYFGFSETLDTGNRGRPNETLVMRVKAARPDFWRGQSFDVWDGRSWQQSDDNPRPVFGSAPIYLRGAPEDREIGLLDYGTDFVQTIYVEEPGPNLIFAAYAPDRVYFSDRMLYELSDGTVRTNVYVPEDSAYTVISKRTAVTPERLRASDSLGMRLGPALHQRYTQLPEVPQRVADLARTVTAGAPTTYDKIRALERWMGENTEYTLNIPPLPRGADAVEQYLFVDKKGFCEQIGSALVVMLRSLGIPARLAVGFTPGERNPFTGLWEVRGKDAHAWAEVWFPGIGWQAFDPTASVPLSGEGFSSAAGAGLASFVERRLPSIPGWLPRMALTIAAVLLPVGAVAFTGGRRLRAQRRRARLPWADRQLDRLERIGARRGRSRREWESVRRYADVLTRSVLPDDRVVVVAEVIEADAFGGPAGSSDADRRRAEELLAGLESDGAGVRSRGR